MKVTIEELRKLIPTIGVDLTPIIQSEPGCGKTSILNLLKEDLGDSYDYIYVDCPVKDMSDIAMTIPNHATKTLESYVGSLFKLDSDKPKVILLDEFMKSPKLLQVIFTRLMLERCVGDTPLPEGSIVFGTSNNQSDGVGDTMLAHAGNRVCIVQMEKPDVTSWLTWATNNKVSALVRAFVHTFPRCLASYTDGNQDDKPVYL
jgi:MoxR-like ATPase